MSVAALVAVDEDADVLRDVERELSERYGHHYRIACVQNSLHACDLLAAYAASGDEIALVLSGQRLSGISEHDLLDYARRLHPDAKRGLMIPWGKWGDRETGEAIFDAIACGRIDHFVLRPADSPDELFHQAISSLLLDWTEARRRSPYTIYVVGKSWSGRAYELRRTLERCAIPHKFCLADSSEGRARLAEAGPESELPVVVFPDGRVLANPTNAELALASGSPVDPEHMEFDLVIVGAGPAGLSAAMYGASEGFSTLVIDEGGLGGQATSSSLIRNYLGFPRGVSGRRLAQQAYDQAWVFGAKFAFMQRVTSLRREGDELVLTLSLGTWVRSRAVLLAVGASYNRLGVPSVEALTGAGVFYGGSTSEAPAMSGRDVYVLGGGNSAGQAALHLARYARCVTLVIRSPELDKGMSAYLVRQVETTPKIRVRVSIEIVGGGGKGRLEYLVLRDRTTGNDERVAADGLCVMIGAHPHTDWLPPEVRRDARGFVLTGSDVPDGTAWPLTRERLRLETSMPGVFAAGDVRHGSVKRVASAVGEGSVAIQLLHQMFAGQALHPHGRPTEATMGPSA